jgi:hypothetical protein
MYTSLNKLTIYKESILRFPLTASNRSALVIITDSDELWFDRTTPPLLEIDVTGKEEEVTTVPLIDSTVSISKTS